MGPLRSCKNYGVLVWVLAVAVGLNALFPHWNFLYEVAIGIPLGAVVNVSVSSLFAYLLTSKRVRHDRATLRRSHDT
ncbi:hypothetical protein [Sulfobacillus harzensis]|uniref:Uncharacterized protein n=1 Tax=Sulfobacillus harzensis TaxID=2729629 RepID=A0A7Y0L2D6_9FIRM|nr:hypothetical protein [Sulfobacillus harzensis]NMP21808.1 hypothetical protein [Sulfobacillus harzensis]